MVDPVWVWDFLLGPKTKKIGGCHKNYGLSPPPGKQNMELYILSTSSCSADMLAQSETGGTNHIPC